ncbi:MAG: pyridoxal-phosphate dependent enzyme, partial [Limisphaerales bacterium]
PEEAHQVVTGQDLAQRLLLVGLGFGQRVHHLAEELFLLLHKLGDALLNGAPGQQGGDIDRLLLADAVAKGATRIITAGGFQSNHTRAAAFCARRLGLEITLIVREPKTGRSPDEIPTGNFLLNQIAGADMEFVSYADYQAQGSVYAPFLERAADASRQRGEKPYVIFEGGSQPLGCFGYIHAVDQMLAQWPEVAGSKHPDALFCAVGSGGTHAGLHLGLELNKIPTNSLYAVNVCDSAEYFQKRVGNLIEETARQFNLPSTQRELQILDGHFGTGYSIATEADLKFYAKLARQEGILLDPTYTGKAFLGMLAEIQKAPDRFGSKILFLHSGGVFGTFAYAEQYKMSL